MNLMDEATAARKLRWRKIWMFKQLNALGPRRRHLLADDYSIEGANHDVPTEQSKFIFSMVGALRGYSVTDWRFLLNDAEWEKFKYAVRERE